jgi:hypothetical protein
VHGKRAAVGFVAASEFDARGEAYAMLERPEDHQTGLVEKRKGFVVDLLAGGNEAAAGMQAFLEVGAAVQDGRAEGQNVDLVAEFSGEGEERGLRLGCPGCHGG